MMKKMFSIVAALLLGLVAVAEPVKSMLGVEGAEIQIEEEEQNLWVWPTESIGCLDRPPSEVRYWDTGVWYNRVADNGYTRKPGSLEYYYFTDSSFHTRNEGWYTMVQFFLLEEGIYSISYDYVCEVTSDNAAFFILQYERSSDGWIYSRRIKTSLVGRDEYIDYKSETRVFTVPEDVMICFWIGGPDIASTGRGGIDVWDVVLKKVD